MLHSLLWMPQSKAPIPRLCALSYLLIIFIPMPRFPNLHYHLFMKLELKGDRLPSSMPLNRVPWQMSVDRPIAMMSGMSPPPSDSSCVWTTHLLASWGAAIFCFVPACKCVVLLFRNIILPTLVFLGYLSAQTPWAFGGTAELTCSEQAIVC